MNITPRFFTPSNDSELNAYMASINTAYTDNFSYSIGPGRSEKYRDAICQHLGFPSGYQQLVQYWVENAFKTFSNDDGEVFSLHAEVFGSKCAAFVAAPIGRLLADSMNEHFPCDSTAFVRDPDINDELGGWTSRAVPAEQMKKQFDRKSWMPLYMGKLMVGYADISSNPHRAVVLQGMLNGLLRLEGTFFWSVVYKSNNNDWVSAVGKAIRPSKEKSFGMTLSLRMSSMDASVMLPVDSVSMTAHSLIVYSNGKKYTIEDGGDKGYMFGDVSFDFASVYGFDLLQAMRLTSHGMQENYHDEPVHMVEWMGSDGVELRLDDDYKSMSLNEGQRIVISTK